MVQTSVDVANTLAGLDTLRARVDNAVSDIVTDGLHLFQLAGIANAPIGTPGNTTNAPGDLARSIDVQGPRGGGGIYSGEVGPTVIYGRQRELGGDIYPKEGIGPQSFTSLGGSPSGGPYLIFTKFGKTIYTKHVHQEGAHYMEKAYNEVFPLLDAVADARIAEALVGLGIL